MENTNKIRNEDFITIETHFGVSEHFIRADTRNKCSENLVATIQEIADILYPNEHFDIYLLPPEKGSYKDIVKFVKKNKRTGALLAVGGLALGFLNYKDTHEAYLNDKKMSVVNDTAKCLELQKMMEDLKKNYEIENIPEKKISDVCGSLTLKKKKNSFYNTLKGDGMVKNNETGIKDERGQTVFSKKIERADFTKYIEPIPDTKYYEKKYEGTVELISPVVKQKKEGQGIAWRGTYYGEDIFFKDILILENGKDIEFYMQDNDFKSQISSKERSFTVGDNMKIVFDIAGEIKGGVNLNQSIYIKEVKNYNEDIIEHKTRVNRNTGNTIDGQSKLF